MTLREYRLAAGLSLRQLAGMMGISKGHLSWVETGRFALQPHNLAFLEWRFGWTDITPVERTQLAPSTRVAARADYCVPDDSRAKAELLAMLGAAVWDGEIPADWRERWRHRDLWAKWLQGAAAQMRERGSVA